MIFRYKFHGAGVGGEGEKQEGEQEEGAAEQHRVTERARKREERRRKVHLVLICVCPLDKCVCKVDAIGLHSGEVSDLVCTVRPLVLLTALLPRLLSTFFPLLSFPFLVLFLPLNVVVLSCFWLFCVSAFGHMYPMASGGICGYKAAAHG